MKTAAILGAAAALSAVAGCGVQGETAHHTPPAAAMRPTPPAGPPRSEPQRQPEQAARPLRHARCPAGASNCRSADGTIIYVESVDPDGDGDAHFVLLSGASVTAPGLSVIDVAKDLRPHPLPGIGDRVSAEGPVFRGSFGQRQIQADKVFTSEGSRSAPEGP
jgi:hypothetical protein